MDPARMMQHYAAQQSAYLGGGIDPSTGMPIQQHNPHDNSGAVASGGGVMPGGVPHDQTGTGVVMDGMRGHVDISTILDQIMNITDQSLDEAQVLFCLCDPKFCSFIPSKSFPVEKVQSLFLLLRNYKNRYY